jgi:uncharacterized membrane protein (DUF106 family)
LPTALPRKQKEMRRKQKEMRRKQKEMRRKQKEMRRKQKEIRRKIALASVFYFKIFYFFASFLRLARYQPDL